MLDTLVIQSHRSPLPYEWLNPCIESVQNWCRKNSYDYQLMGDELFDSLGSDVQAKTQNQIVIATDIARLHALQQGLLDGYETVVWLDADFLIFNPQQFILPDDSHAVGREVWVQGEEHGQLKVYKKVHNAFLMFKQDNSFLDFYADTAERLVQMNSGSMPPQFVGPKLLTALHNIVQLPVLETAAMFSPAVIKDVLNEGGPALDLFRQHHTGDICAANLCSSSCERGDITEQQMQAVCNILFEPPPNLFHRCSSSS